MKKIFICKDCRKVFSYDNNKTLCCTVCHKTLFQTEYTPDEWYKLDKNTKERLKADPTGIEPENSNDNAANISSEHLNSNTNISVANNIDFNLWKKDLDSIRYDIHFIKTVVLVYVILSIIGACIGAISLL